MCNRQLSDSEIIKECRNKGLQNGSTLGSHSGFMDIVADRFEELLVENERLREEICIQHKIIDERGAEILRHDRCIRTLHEKLETAKAEAYKEFAKQLDAEIESSDKYIREYDDSKVQKAYNKGLRDALKVLKELVGE